MAAKCFAGRVSIALLTDTYIFVGSFSTGETTDEYIFVDKDYNLC